MDYSITLNDYLQSLSSKAPTPGGGNVSAFSGVLAASLAIMVCNLTIGKKKYVDVESEMIDLKNKLENLKNRFSELADEDNKAFEKVMEAFKLPKETDKEKLERAAKIDEATLGAAEVPSDVVNVCKQILPNIKTIVIKGNQNSLSDAGVAASLVNTAAEGAFLNVLINCTSLSNQTLGNEFLKRTEIIYEEVKISCAEIIELINNKLRS
ncbi:MAG: cyclodeaminase/cyclohydrolase family protein [Bacteroidetes bacterium]|nr:cyclodeaminase/cyclohydrolase family protein [Bacteroidota bacterium]MCH8325148.1 cyclodeaminase/cyclohydrolase family protein [Bacteroidota bacterium]